MPEPPLVEGLVCARKRSDALLLTVVDGNGVVERACTALGAHRVEPESLSLEDLFVEYSAAPETVS